MRFFLIAYSVNNQDFSGFGNLFVGREDFKFPNNTELKEAVVETASKNIGREVSTRDVVIINIYEFKSAGDFYAFNNQD